ncbi:MAG: KpsF/GutQ family sugar-phosphate isomerase [Candidatus Cloacimonetes bacterium]|nr:KpsF/GutQ family sugar-phosphate isomerase [Candidatus Cloacimonadota bacterium]MBS3766992.1 KpsF/GutQ family sugar-phosphate isomerase [Candidatus Cloacimonadota bacterium]
MAIKEEIKSILEKEAQAISEISYRVSDNVEKAIEIISICKGKIVLTGMGKTGIIARKISATLASTGTSSIYLHPAEAIHGDLGMVSQEDVVMMISNSGETKELIEILPYFKTHKNKIICLTGNTKSTLASSGDVIIDISVSRDMEPLGLVPMASTTAALSMGNAICTIILQQKNFKKRDFALRHPGGSIGKRLLIKVKDLMHAGEENPVITNDKNLKEAIMVMTSKGLGSVSVVNRQNKLVGIITDGDLRRILQAHENPLWHNITDLMTKDPKSITPNTHGIDAIEIMEKYKITMLPVVNKDYEPIAMLHMHDLIKAGIVENNTDKE